MRRIAAKLVVGVAIMVMGMFAADTAVGTWKLNPAKSKSTSLNKLIAVRSAKATPDGGVKVTRTEQTATGGPSNATYTYKYDGKEYPTSEASLLTISVKRVNANTSSWEVKRSDGKYHQTGRIVISKDGKTMTQTFKKLTPNVSRYRERTFTTSSSG